MSEPEPSKPTNLPAWELEPDVFVPSTELAEGEEALIFPPRKPARTEADVPLPDDTRGAPWGAPGGLLDTLPPV